MNHCKTITIVNQKGGVGKTTSTVNLGVGLAQAGNRVLLVDDDPQHSLTISLGIRNADEDLDITLATAMQAEIRDESVPWEEGIIHSSEGVDLLPANIELSGVEMSLFNAMSREQVLKSVLSRVKENYNYILIDCIPTLEKTAREAKADTGKNEGSASITDGFAHTATGSAGDTMEYQIVSTLPTITSQATALSTYNFYDTLCEGLTYSKDAGVTIEFFTDAACTDKAASWNKDSGKFTVTYSEDGRHMTVDITKAGLEEINGATTNKNGKLYTGYSNYTARVTYSAVINADKTFVYGEKGNENTVILTWKRTSGDYYDTLIDDCHVFSFGLDLTKLFSDVDAETAAETKLYDSVKFKIQNKTDGTWIIAKRNDEEGHHGQRKMALVFPTNWRQNSP